MDWPVFLLGGVYCKLAGGSVPYQSVAGWSVVYRIVASGVYSTGDR